MSLRKLTREEVEIEFTAEEEDVEVRGNVIVSGDDALDKEVEDDVIRRLNLGYIEAWFSAKVTARWKGFEGVNYLGGCSYGSLKEFTDSGTYQDMINQALEELQEEVEAAFESLRELQEQ